MERAAELGAFREEIGYGGPKKYGRCQEGCKITRCDIYTESQKENKGRIGTLTRRCQGRAGEYQQGAEDRASGNANSRSQTIKLVDVDVSGASNVIEEVEVAKRIQVERIQTLRVGAAKTVKEGASSRAHHLIKL